VQNLALKLTFDDPGNGSDQTLENAVELRLVESTEHDCYVFFRGNLFAQYQKRDNYSRNLIMAQLFLCHHVAQKILSEVFQLTIPHISTLIGSYRRAGSAGIEDHTAVRIGNNRKIKGHVCAEIIKQLDVKKEDRPTYDDVARHIKRKLGVDISAHRIGCWWRDYKNETQVQKQSQTEMELITVGESEITPTPEQYVEESNELTQDAKRSDDEEGMVVEDEWQANTVAGCFILYAMLDKSQFLKPFLDNLKNKGTALCKDVERVMLTLFFMHALRLKSIEQTKHLLAAHFGPLVLGAFCRLQSLRYAIDNITEQQHFDKAVTQHYQNLSQCTELGDDIYYTDGHFSCYYGKYAIPKGYDARRKQAARGRNTIYLHNSLGHNIVSFESPTNTALSVDIGTLIGEMKTAFGDVKGKNLFFDRGGFSADCFKKITEADMYFATYLKYRKRQAEIEESLFEEIEINLHGTVVKNHIHETQTQSKAYGTLRTIIFIGKRGKQIPVITTNPTLSAAMG